MKCVINSPPYYLPTCQISTLCDLALLSAKNSQDYSKKITEKHFLSIIHLDTKFYQVSR